MAIAKEKKEKTQSAEKKKTVRIETKNSKVAYDVLVQPWITEKSYNAMTNGKYTFRVALGSDKKQIKKAVEGIYGVNVESIAVVNIPAKKRNYGRYEGKKSAVKKAIVKLKTGQSIEIFKGA